MEEVICPHCGSEYFTKAGNKNGMQRYQCKACKKKFVFGKYEPKPKIEAKNNKTRNQHPTNKFFTLGKEWEDLVQEILKSLGRNFKSQKKIENGKVVDFIDNNTIIECKLSARNDDLLETIKKYSEYCEKIEIWSLNKLFKKRKDTYISKKQILHIIEHKIGIWSNYIDEFKEKDFNVEVLYYEDIIELITDSVLRQKLEELYVRYDSMLLNHGETIYFAPNLIDLIVDYEPFLVSDTNSNNTNRIYISSSIKNSFLYSIKDKYISKPTKDNAHDKMNWQINGLIKILDLKKFKIPENFYEENANRFSEKSSFLELEFEYINKNGFLNYETIFTKFYLIDAENNRYNSLLGYEIDNRLLMKRKSTFIQRHIPDMNYNQKTICKLYFEIPDELTVKEFCLEACDSNNNIADIVLVSEQFENDKSNDILQGKSNNQINNYTPEDNMTEKVEKNSNNITEDNVSNNIEKNYEDNKISKNVNKAKEYKNKIKGCLIFGAIIFVIIILLCIINNEKINEYYQKNNKYKLGLENKKNCNYETAIELFTELDNFRKSNNQIKECYFLLGNQAYKLGEFDNAITYYEKSFENDAINEEIKKCNKLKSILGTYQFENLIITLSNNWIAYKVSDHIENYGEKYYFEYDYENNKIIIDESFYTRDKETKKQSKTYHCIEYELKNGSLYLAERCYSKINNNIEMPYTLYLPQIGMTFEEVENSTFGLPDRIVHKGGYGSGVAKIKHYNPDKYPENWRYEFDDSTVVISFKNGKVDDIIHYDSDGFLKY